MKPVPDFESMALLDLIDELSRLSQRPLLNAGEIALIRAIIRKKIRLLEAYQQPYR